MTTIITIFIVTWRADINNIQKALGKIHNTMSHMLNNFCEDEYEIVRLNKLYFTIKIIILIP